MLLKLNSCHLWYLMGFDLVRCWATPAWCSAEWEPRFSHVKRTPHLQRCDPKPDHFKLCSFLNLFVPLPSKQHSVPVSITFLPVISPVRFASSHLIFKFNNLPIRGSAWYGLDLTYFIISPKLGLLAVNVNYIKGSCSYIMHNFLSCLIRRGSCFYHTFRKHACTKSI